MSQIRLPAAAAEALARGRFVEAVKIVRATGGLDLKAAHDLVQSYQAQALHGAAPARPVATAAAAPRPGFAIPQQALDAIARGDFIQAIAALRTANPNLDLKTAKDAIDQMRGQKPANAAAAAPSPMRARVPTVVDGDRGGVTGVMVLLAVMLAAVGWWWLRG